MTYDGFLMSAIVAELRCSLLRGRVQKIRQTAGTELVFEVRGVGHTYLLLISVDARFSRIYLTTSPGKALPEPPNFCMLLRKYVSGAFVTSIEQIGMDRVAHIGLESSEHGKLMLILELMGKHSNLILVNTDGNILGAAKNIGASMSRYRQVLPGREYIAPPGEPKVDLRQIDGATFDGLWRQSFRPESDQLAIRQWLMDKFSGVGPFLADEIVGRSDGEIDRVRHEILQLGNMVRLGDYEPVFVTDAKGAGVMVYPMPSLQYPASQQHPRDNINEALDALYRSLISRSSLDEERTQTLTAIRRAIASRKQTLKSLNRTLQESQKAERYKQIGELVLSNLHLVNKGAISITVLDFFDPEMKQIEIELDEKLEPQATAERYFKRYRKARDATSTAKSRLGQIEAELSRLQAALDDAESADKIEELRRLRSSLISSGLLRQGAAAHEKQETEFEGNRIRRFTTPDGYEILYGESSTANDYLTQRVAKPNDIWLHARQITGSHVIVRMSGRKSGAPRPVLSRAAKIAAMNCDAKHSSLVPVDYTLRKYVQKPRGSAPGFVIYRNEKTIDVNPKE